MDRLDSAGVSDSMSWEEAMKLIINNPMYRVLKTLSERKAAFLEWRDVRREERLEARSGFIASNASLSLLCLSTASHGQP